MARNLYYPCDFEAHKNLSHKQFSPKVYYFMDYAVCQISIFQNLKDTENHQIDEDFDIAVKLFDNLELETNELLGHLN